MNEKIRRYNELSDKISSLLAQGDDVNTVEIAELKMERQNLFNSMSNDEREMLRIQRPGAQLVGDPSIMAVPGFTIVVEAFFNRRTEGGELQQITLPGDLTKVLANAFGECVKAVLQDFQEQGVWSRMAERDPRITENLLVDTRMATALLKKHS